MKGVDYLSGSQSQNKAKEMQKYKACHGKFQQEGPFKGSYGVLEIIF